MTLFEPPWFRPVLAENFTLLQLFWVANPNFHHTGFTPVGHAPAGHMLEVIIIEKDTTKLPVTILTSI
jgi:hypothetical protein